LPSRFDLHGRANGNQRPDLVDLLVGNRDAAVGPIHLTVCRANPAILGAKPVDFDVTAGTHAEFAGVFLVARVGLRNMQRAVELAGGFLLINDVESFWCFVVTDALFGSDGLPAERDLVGF
jgi:hypothetical protein